MVARRLIYYIATSLDGFIAHSDGTWDGFVMDGPHTDEYLATLRTYSAVVMGRATYEIAPKMGVADPYPWMETFVFSRNMKPVGHPNVRVVREDAEGFVADLKRRPADDGSTAPIYLAGGGAFAASMFAADLVDEVMVKLNPFLMGEGIRVTARLGSMAPLRLVETKDYGNGVLLLRYVPMRQEVPTSFPPL
ncbi:MAG: dihydrofolate reductase family protein [Bryobacterales bacterium]|nr:dihydrofolate reductase family protein [Bryobacterales bacterium]